MKKNFVKNFAMALILPCVFMFSGCGSPLETEAQIDTKGNYEICTDFDEYIEKETTKTTINNYRFTTQGESENMGIKLLFNHNIIVSLNDDNQIVNAMFHFRKDVIASTEKLQELKLDEEKLLMYNKDFTVYVSGDYIYYDGINIFSDSHIEGKYKTSKDNLSYFDISGITQLTNDYFSNVVNIYKGNELVVKKSNSKDVIKFSFSYPDVAEPCAYAVFEKDQLQCLQINREIVGEGYMSKNNTVLSLYKDKLEMPNFNDYLTINPPVVAEE